MERIETPFSDEQVKNLNEYQAQGKFHPFTCCGGHEGKQPECERNSGKSDGLLKATNEGWVCPCGKYTQKWAHGFMADAEACKK